MGDGCRRGGGVVGEACGEGGLKVESSEGGDGEFY